jgi:hypothetical protein
MKQHILGEDSHLTATDHHMKRFANFPSAFSAVVSPSVFISVQSEPVMMQEPKAVV